MTVPAISQYTIPERILLGIPLLNCPKESAPVTNSRNKLPIPFACVAANVVNGEQIVFHDGILSTAMRASMAIPGVFTPVRQDSMVLVDGGIVNNYPADVVKAMGADIIIGVDVQNALKKADKLNSVPEELQLKVKRSLQRISDEGKDYFICIII